MGVAAALKEVWTVRDVLKLHGLDVLGSRARCPLCDPEPSHHKSASFSMTERGWHCFRCGEHGDIIRLEMVLSDCGFKQAVRNLRALRCGTISGRKYVSPWQKLRDLEERFRVRERELDYSKEVSLRRVALKWWHRMIDHRDAAMMQDMVVEQHWRDWLVLEEERVAALFAMKHEIREELDQKRKAAGA